MAFDPVAQGLASVKETNNNTFDPIASGQASAAFDPISSGVAKPKPTLENFEFADPDNPTFEEFKLKTQLEDEQSTIEWAGDVLKAIPKGVLQMARDVKAGLVEASTLDAEKAKDKPFRRITSLVEAGARNIEDLADLAEEGIARLGDLSIDDEEEKLRRRFDRHVESIRENQKRNIEGSLISPEFTDETLVRGVQPLADPSLLIPGGLASAATRKAASALSQGSKAKKVLETTGKILDVPAVTKKGLKLGARGLAKASALGTEVLKAPVKLLPLAAKTADVASGIGPTRGVVSLASKLGGFNSVNTFVNKLNLSSAGKSVSQATINKLNQTKDILNVMGDSSMQLSFIDALLLDPKIPQSVKNKVAIAGVGGQKAMDLAFDSAANMLTVGTIQGLMASIQTSDAEEIGMAIGGGLPFGVLPVGSKTKKLTQEQRKAVRDNVLRNAARRRQLDLQSKMSKQDQSAFDMLSSKLVDTNIQLLDKDQYRKAHKKYTGVDADPDVPLFRDEEGVLWVDSSQKNVTPHLMVEITNRVSKDYLQQNPDLSADITAEFVDPNSNIRISDRSGNQVPVGGALGEIVDIYNKSQPDASTHITDIDGAVSKLLEFEVESLFTDNNKNLIKGLQGKPSTKQALRDTAHASLTKLGLVDADSASPLTGKQIPKTAEGLLKNSHISRSINNLDRLNDTINKDLRAEEKAKAQNLRDIKNKNKGIFRESKARFQRRRAEQKKEVSEIEKSIKKDEDLIARGEEIIKKQELKEEAKRIEEARQQARSEQEALDMDEALIQINNEILRREQEATQRRQDLEREAAESEASDAKAKDDALVSFLDEIGRRNNENEINENLRRQEAEAITAAQLKDQADIDTRIAEDLIVAEDKNHGPKGTPERKNFISKAKQMQAIMEGLIEADKLRPTDAGLGKGNEGTTFPEAVKTFYEGSRGLALKGSRKKMNDIEKSIKEFRPRFVSFVKTASKKGNNNDMLKALANGELANKIENIAGNMQFIGTQTVPFASRNRTLSSGIAVNLDVLNGMIRENLVPNSIKDSMNDFARRIRQGEKMRDIKDNDFFEVSKQVSGLINQIDPRLIVEIRQ